MHRIAEATRDPDAVPKVTVPEVLRLSLASAESALERHVLEAHPPDVLIRIPENACRTADFHRAADMIELGTRAAEDALTGTPLRSG